MMGGWEDWERWTQERDNDRRRVATRNTRILAIAERWGPTVDDALREAMARYLRQRVPDPSARPAIRVSVRADVPAEHARSPRTVSWTAAPAGPIPGPGPRLPDLVVVLGSWRERLGERIRFRAGDAEHPASGDLADWLRARLDTQVDAALGRHP